MTRFDSDPTVEGGSAEVACGPSRRYRVSIALVARDERRLVVSTIPMRLDPHVLLTGLSELAQEQRWAGLKIYPGHVWDDSYFSFESPP
jgi:hypothetical protein